MQAKQDGNWVRWDADAQEIMAHATRPQYDDSLECKSVKSSDIHGIV
jgi:hypothetical protein